MIAALLLLVWFGVLALVVARLYGWRDRRAAVPGKPVKCLRIRPGVRP